jgi:hypothetical protein
MWAGSYVEPYRVYVRFEGTRPIARMTRTLTRRPAPAEAFQEH